MMMNLQFREAQKSDIQDVININVTAFGEAQGQEIADLIIELLDDPSAKPLLSIVALAEDNDIVGHILFTNTRIKNFQETIRSSILAPLSVHPDYQNQGVGGQLIVKGLEKLKASGIGLIFVLGHPGYYPKYGFVTAGIRGFEAPYPIEPKNSDAWMVQELSPGIIGRVSGQVLCADALNHPKHWQE